MSVTISIIIPAYNMREWIDETLESVWDQTYNDFEIIVVDDGSIDGIKSYLENKYLHLLKIIRQQNRGLAGARNTGIRHAEGKFLFFLDADDIIMPEKLERQVHILNSRPEIGVVYSDYALFYNDKNKQLDHPQVDIPEGIIWEQLLKMNCMVVHAALMRKELILKYGYFDETMRSCADWDLWLRLALHGVQFAFDGSKSALYRQRNDSLSRNLVVKAKADLTVLQNASKIALKLNHPAKAKIPNQIAYRLYRLAKTYINYSQRLNGIDCLIKSFHYDFSCNWKRRYALLLLSILLPSNYLLKKTINYLDIG